MVHIFRESTYHSTLVQVALLLAMAATLLVLSKVGRTSARQQTLAEGWEGWVQGLMAPFGWGGTTNEPPTPVMKTPTMNLAAHSKKPLRVVHGSNLASNPNENDTHQTESQNTDPNHNVLDVNGGNPDTKVIENFARACGRDREQACSTQLSTTSLSGLSARAIEATPRSGDECTHTNIQSNPWWKVNFGRVIKVTGLHLASRSDWCALELKALVPHAIVMH